MGLFSRLFRKPIKAFKVELHYYPAGSLTCKVYIVVFECTTKLEALEAALFIHDIDPRSVVVDYQGCLQGVYGWDVRHHCDIKKNKIDLFLSMF